MRLTVQTDYSLRLLIYLAVAHGRGRGGDGGDAPAAALATVDEVAEAYGISRDHVAKVAHRLGLDGYVETVRGRAGGVRLGRPAAEIGLGEVVRRIESDLALVPCMAPLDAPCRIRPCCALRLAMQRARAVFLETLDGYSLADLARPRGALARALAIEPRRRNRGRRGRAGRVE